MSATSPLLPSATSLDARLPRGGWAVFVFGLGLWLGWAEHPILRVGGGFLLLVLLVVLLFESGSWLRARPLRGLLGAPRLSVTPLPAAPGATLRLAGQLEVREELRVEAAALLLVRDESRVETYGAQSRERMIWVRVHDRELWTRREFTLEAGSTLRFEAQTTLPADAGLTGERRRWWILLELSIRGCPVYTATFPLEVREG